MKKADVECKKENLYWKQKTRKKDQNCMKRIITRVAPSLNLEKLKLYWKNIIEKRTPL